jgi:hypothetical protein
MRIAGRVFVPDISHPGTAIGQFPYNILIYRIHCIDAAVFLKVNKLYSDELEDVKCN